jgi:hypothetical protein
MMPRNIWRGEGDAFRDLLVALFIQLYKFGARNGYEGDVMLDPLMGSGTTCAMAKLMGRNKGRARRCNGAAL